MAASVTSSSCQTRIQMGRIDPRAADGESGGSPVAQTGERDACNREHRCECISERPDMVEILGLSIGGCLPNM